MSVEFANWSGLVTSRPAEVRSVATVADVRAAVAAAAASGWIVRCAGSRHSHSPLLPADGGLILLTDDLAGPPVVDRRTGTARIAAGTKLAAIGEPLWDAGLSLANQGDVDVQSVAGLIGTGVHGTGPTLPSISSAVTAASIVMADGELVTTEGDPDLLEATRLNLGTLGVVVDVTLECVPAYYLHEQCWHEAVEPLIERLDELIAATRHFEFFWYPPTDQAYAKTLHPVPGPADPMPGVRGEYVDRAYRVFPSVREEKHTEMEYSVPAAAGPRCFQRIRKLMREQFPGVELPVEYRTLAADDGWISPARGRPTVTISVHQGVGLPYADFFTACERIFRDHDGRPHWGKCHNLSGTELSTFHPATWDRFWAVQGRLDPEGCFLNDHTRSLARAVS